MSMKNIIKHLWIQYKLWLFARQIGATAKSYKKLGGQAERMEYLTKEFGRACTEAMYIIDMEWNK